MGPMLQNSLVVSQRLEHTVRDWARPARKMWNTCMMSAAFRHSYQLPFREPTRQRPGSTHKKMTNKWQHHTQLVHFSEGNKTNCCGHIQEEGIQNNYLKGARAKEKKIRVYTEQFHSYRILQSTRLSAKQKIRGFLGMWRWSQGKGRLSRAAGKGRPRG